MQQRLNSYLRRPVKRQGAEHYLFVILLSFGASVTLTRLFLAMTGYPQLGGGELHIAHALWGGLLLFIASMLPLIYANRWVYMAGATLAGTGVGLFIDEVGKFITQSNDYFYPLAAPIVYAFFLLTVMLYLRIKRRPHRSARAELYRVFDAMEEVLEQDLDPQERDELEARLRYVAEHSDRPDLTRLANDLLEFLRFETMELAPRRLGPVERMFQRWQAFEARWVTRRRSKVVLAGAMLGLALAMLIKTGLALVVLALVNAALTSSGPLSGSDALIQDGIASWQMNVPRGIFRYANLAMELSVGLLLLFSAGLFLFGKDHLATAFGSLGLLLALAAVNLLVFYYDQFSSILTALLQLGVLSGIVYYRQKYVTTAKAEAREEQTNRRIHEVHEEARSDSNQ
jgi:hypothetical protein